MRRLTAHSAHGPYPVHLVSKTSAPGRRSSLLRSGSVSAWAGLLVRHPSPGALGPCIHAEVPEKTYSVLHPPLALIRRQQLGQLLSQQHPQGLWDTWMQNFRNGTQNTLTKTQKYTVQFVLNTLICPQLFSPTINNFFLILNVNIYTQ